MYERITSLIRTHLPHILFVKASYLVDDDMYVIEPYYDGNDTLEVFNEDVNFRGMILDEHGKLIISFSYQKDKNDFTYCIYELEKSKTKIFETQDKYDIRYIIEDYKLKKLVSRLISTVEAYGIKPKKHDRGSTELEHVLWMLYEIYTQKKPLSKRYNWLGFIQGVLVLKNIIDIKHERDIMSQIF